MPFLPWVCHEQDEEVNLFVPLVEILISCKRLGKNFTGKNVLVYTDNQSVMSMVNSGHSKDLHAMSMLQEIFWIWFVYNFNVSAKYVKGIDNIEADFLSRLFAFSPVFCCLTIYFSLCSHVAETQSLRDLLTKETCRLQCMAFADNIGPDSLSGKNIKNLVKFMGTYHYRHLKTRYGAFH